MARTLSELEARQQSLQDQINKTTDALRGTGPEDQPRIKQLEVQRLDLARQLGKVEVRTRTLREKEIPQKQTEYKNLSEKAKRALDSLAYLRQQRGEAARAASERCREECPETKPPKKNGKTIKQSAPGAEPGDKP